MLAVEYSLLEKLKKILFIYAHAYYNLFTYVQSGMFDCSPKIFNSQKWIKPLHPVDTKE